jgi:ornithine cyclodeaminase/alanine dehydrogenase
MKLGEEVRYLSNAEVEACALALDEVEQAVERMFAAKASDAAVMKPKLALHGEGLALFLASPGVMTDPAYAGIKWVGVGDNDKRGLPHIAGTILLNDAETGMPVAIMDARWITAVRTAAISAVAAKRLARPESRSIAFVACGVQARAHLAALKPHFPIERVIAYSRRRSTSETFAEEVRAQGFEVEVVEDPRAAVSGGDIVVTTTPVEPRTEPFLDVGWAAEGAFVSMVDLGFSWISDSMRGLDRVVTDDISQAGSENLSYPEPYDGEVADLVAGTLRGRKSDAERTALIFAGLGLADVAVAAAVYERADARGIGQILKA